MGYGIISYILEYGIIFIGMWHHIYWPSCKLRRGPKRRKFDALAEAHQYEPIAVETMGVYEGSTGVIFRALGLTVLKQQGSPGRLTGSVKTQLRLFSEAMCSVSSQPVGRGFRGS